MYKYNGNITDTFTYDTYGKLIEQTGTSEIIFGYNGRDGVITDKNGLIYMRARYYSPELRRFINADIVSGQISNAITLNRYAYANGNPVSNTDPFGLYINNTNSSRISVVCIVDGGSRSNTEVSIYDKKSNLISSKEDTASGFSPKLFEEDKLEKKSAQLNQNENALWKKFGFEYGDSIEELIRKEEGLPPIAFEQWIENGGVVTPKKIVSTGPYGSKTIIEEITYVPKEQTKDYYIEMLGGFTEFDYWGGASAIISFFPINPYISAAIMIIDGIIAINNLADKEESWRYEEAMNKNEGVLIVNLSFINQYNSSSFTAYYSWDGDGEIENFRY